MDNHEEPSEELASHLLTDEEQYFLERSYKELVESIPRIEDVAKFLIGATATTSGLFLAAIKLAHGDKVVSEPFWFIPFISWSLSILALTFVLFPFRYETSQAEPAAWKRAFAQARERKYRWLATGAGLFVFGILSALYPLTR